MRFRLRSEIRKKIRSRRSDFRIRSNSNERGGYQWIINMQRLRSLIPAALPMPCGWKQICMQQNKLICKASTFNKEGKSPALMWMS
ncbi:MAG TPA: hypothetical protein DCG49_02550 [Ruminococcus sp.]|nr:hypothetical protein [Ruminococcus sp.]